MFVIHRVSSYDSLRKRAGTELIFFSLFTVYIGMPRNLTPHSLCEETFAWLTKYGRITRHMNQDHFLFYILNICDLKNNKIAKNRIVHA